MTHGEYKVEDYKIVIERCEKCGRIRKYSEWVRPQEFSTKDKKDMRSKSNRIKVIQSICHDCKGEK